MTTYNFIYYPFDKDIQQLVNNLSVPWAFNELPRQIAIQEIHRRGYNWQNREYYKDAPVEESQRQHELKRLTKELEKQFNRDEGYTVNPHSLTEDQDKEYTGPSFTRNLYAPGSFKDPNIYRMYNEICEMELIGTMSEIADEVVKLGHIKIRRDWTGTQLLNGKSGHCKGWKLKGLA